MAGEKLSAIPLELPVSKPLTVLTVLELPLLGTVWSIVKVNASLKVAEPEPVTVKKPTLAKLGATTVSATVTGVYVMVMPPSVIVLRLSEVNVPVVVYVTVAANVDTPQRIKASANFFIKLPP
jgi:hypothetical protein